MIKMESPSFAFNSVDVPSPHYRMWESMNGYKGMTAAMLVDKILNLNRLAWEFEQSPLKNIIINSHGLDGGGRISIGGRGEVGISMHTVPEFSRLKTHNLGTIWLVACQAAAGALGKQLCQALRSIAGAKWLLQMKIKIPAFGELGD